MALQTRQIAESKIKLRWNERYVSEGVNIQNSINSRGIYRGGFIEETATPSGSFRVTPGADVDTTLLHFQSADGIATVVRFTTDQVLDMSAQLPAVGDLTWYVYISVSYATYSDTTGVIEVSDVAPTGDEIMLGVIDIPNGSTTIENSMVRTDGSARTKTAFKRGIIVRKAEEIPALASRTSFQLTGKVYDFSASGISPATVTDKMELRGQLYREPLRGVNGKVIRVGPWYKDAGLTQPVLTADLDEDGCYDSPYIAMSFAGTGGSDYSGAFWSLYWGYVPMDEIPNGLSDDVFYFEAPDHSDDMYAPDLTGTPDSVSSQVLSGTLQAMMGFVNGRIRTIAPDSSPADWVLLWASNANGGGSNQTNIYWKNGDFAMITNGTLSGNNATPNSPGTMRVWTQSFNTYMRKSVATVALDITNSAVWDEYRQNNSGIEEFILPLAKQFVFDGYPQVRADISAVSNFQLFTLLDMTDFGTRIYMGGSGETEPSLYLSFNCSWDNTNDEWVRDSGLADSWVLRAGSGGLFFGKKNAPGSSTPWALTAWDESFHFGQIGSGGEYLNCAESIGGLYEICRVSMRVKPIVGNITASGFCPMNWRNKRDAAPSTVSRATTSPPGDPPRIYDGATELSSGDMTLAFGDVTTWGARAYSALTNDEYDNTYNNQIIAVQGTESGSKHSYYVLSNDALHDDFHFGDMIRVTGMTNTANNGIKLVIGATDNGANALVYVRESLVTNASPPATNTIEQMTTIDSLLLDIDVEIYS